MDKRRYPPEEQQALAVSDGYLGGVRVRCLPAGLGLLAALVRHHHPGRVEGAVARPAWGGLLQGCCRAASGLQGCCRAVSEVLQGAQCWVIGKVSTPSEEIPREFTTCNYLII